MVAEVGNVSNYSGILGGIKARLEQNRLGDLLVRSGCITKIQLREALALQKASCQQLGDVLLQQKVIRRKTLLCTLVQQYSLRFVAASFSIFLSLSSAGYFKSARAGTIKDVPVQLSLMVESNVRGIPPVNYYPQLFGSMERKSSNLGPFVKWSGMFDSFQEAMMDKDNQAVGQEIKDSLRGLNDLPLKIMVQRVNDIINKRPYIEDSENWSKSDYWANPVEFFKHGGDCEDFAIAKYTALRLLGVPEESLRLAIVHDKIKDIPHAILVVYTGEGPLILDNQFSKVRRADKITRYKPIFSINRQAWWLHTQEKTPTLIATAAK